MTGGEMLLWPEYYREFPCFSEASVRPGCHPRKLLHQAGTKKAIVLVHGLTDSPYYLTAIAEYFHHFLGYDVYLPLLHCHGLREPGGMAGVSLAEWKKNVRFAIRTAAAGAARVSLGGLSTGGALSFYLGCTEPAVSGELYLFSAALGLYGGRWGLLSRPLESLLRSPLVRRLHSRRPLIGCHPYRYDRVPLNSAGELARLIGEIDRLMQPPCQALRTGRIFAAWSEADRVINVKKIRSLRLLADKGRFVPFVIDRAAGVEHACVVLSEPVYALGSRPEAPPLEVANPRFQAMMAALRDFEATA